MKGTRITQLVIKAFDSRQITRRRNPRARVQALEPRAMLTASSGTDVGGGVHASIAASEANENVDAFHTPEGPSDANELIALPGVSDGNPQSLRAAIDVANMNGADDIIFLEEGVYQLSLAGRNEDSNLQGDLDFSEVGRTVTIVGAGPGKTVIDAGEFDRAFHIHAGVTVILSGVNIRRGSAIGSGVAGSGGAILNEGGTVSISASAFTDNFAISRGGGVYNGGSMELSRSQVFENHVQLGTGGGVHNNGNMSIVQSGIARNQSPFGPGISNSGDLVLLESTVSENRTVTSAAVTNSGILHIINTTISGNSGRGLNNGNFSQAHLINSTITNNTTTTSRGGGGIFNDLFGQVQLQNSIVAGNHSSTSNPDVSGSSPFTSLGHNLIGDRGVAIEFVDGVNGNIVGTSDNPIIALLGPLRDNGGPTQTHALQIGSLAIDAGSDVGAPSTDQRGVPRPQNNASDIGAFEYQFDAVEVANGDLLIVGTPHNDSVIVTARRSGLFVHINRTQFGPYDVSEIDRILADVREGNDIVIASRQIGVPMALDGGVGNDFLASGSGDDILSGGHGNDLLFGARGHDILVGGEGNDLLFGGSGRDLLIGGVGLDFLSGGQGQNILIGGTTAHDDKNDALLMIMAEWKSPLPFSERVDNITNGGGLNGETRLEPGVSVDDDEETDTILGGSDEDLFFGFDDRLLRVDENDVTL